MSYKCDRCNNKSNESIRIHPIDEYGHSLENVYLCSNCREEWGKVFAKNVKRTPCFHKSWAISWKKFMKKTLKEEVQFT